MPKLSKQKEIELEAEKKRARELYRAGFSLRAIGDLHKRSHEWVRQAIKH